MSTMEIHSEISERHEITLSTEPEGTDRPPKSSPAREEDHPWMQQRTLGATTLATAAYTPPSPSSSPSHEFSFTISLTSSASSSSSSTSSLSAKDPAHIKPKSSQAIDLTPADDIFFHGHLLPLRLLSSLPTSPRCSSTNSIDNSTLPDRELVKDIRPSSLLLQSHNGTTTDSSCITSSIIGNLDDKRSKGCSFNSYEYNTKYHHNKQHDHQHQRAAASAAADYTPTGRIKAKTFSIFSITKRRKDNNIKEEGEGEDKKKDKRKTLRFELSQLFRKYMRAVRPRMFSKGRTTESLSINNNNNNHQIHHHRQQVNCSSSGNLSPQRGGGFGCRQRSKSILQRRGQFSAPASMRTSPTNSGVLAVAPTGRNKSLDKIYSSCSNDSTMEELQAAIQSAIAHCKNSITVSQEKKLSI